MVEFDSNDAKGAKSPKTDGRELVGMLWGIAIAGLFVLGAGAIAGPKMAWGAAQIEGMLLSAVLSSGAVVALFTNVSSRQKWWGCFAATLISVGLWIGSEILWHRSGADLAEVGMKALALGIAGWCSVGLYFLAAGELGEGNRLMAPEVERVREASPLGPNGFDQAMRNDSGEEMLARQNESAKKNGERAVYRARMSVAKRKAHPDFESESEIEYVSPEALRLAREAIARASESTKR